MKRILLAAFIGLAVSSPVKADELPLLKGNVYEVTFTDELSSLDWTEWRKKVQDEVHRRLKFCMAFGGQYSGYTDVRVTVSRKGEISVDTLVNKSINLNKLVSETYFSLRKTKQGRELLKFPPQSKREYVIAETIYKISDKEEISYLLGDIEVIRP